MKTRKILTGLALGMAAAAAGPLAMHADVLYSNSFQTGSSWPEWSNNQVSDNIHYSRFLGRFTNQLVSLTLTLPTLPPPPPDFEIPDDDGGGGGPAPYWIYSLAFDFHCIDSWDGYEPTHGIDRFEVRINGTNMFNETFANQHNLQSYTEPPTLGRAHLGFDGRWLDSSYRLTIPFVVAPGTTSFTFEGIGLLGPLGDESWGLDDVHLSTMLVPAPGAAALLASCGLLAGRRRRR
ncbi:MAG: hypothetical protein H7Y88_13095 [Phycisphaerales bacterium]|nr:hypothetical protein [Phycisphaerales bacterium]